MLSTGAAPPAVQLAITLLLCLVPTLALFGLLRLLERLRDDELIERWAANNDESVQPDPLNAFLAEGSGDGSTPDRRSRDDGRSDALPGANAAAASEESTVRCRHCGAPNPEGVRYCEECIGRL